MTCGLQVAFTWPSGGQGSSDRHTRLHVALPPLTFSQIMASAVMKAASTPGWMVSVYLPASALVLGFLNTAGGGGTSRVR